MANAKISEARLRRIKKRQWLPAWGKDYVPAQWATPQEAPGLSMPTILRPKKLGGRAVHCLSQNEMWVAILALYHPGVWDLHEQKVLFPQAIPHFLQGHPRALGMTFKSIQGTLAVAERMGVYKKHPKCRVRLEGGEVKYAPFPYLGDILLFLEDQDGPFAVNLTVKDKLESFRRRGPRPGVPRIMEDDPGVLNRHALEKAYYQDADIPTRQVVGRMVDIELRANLHDLFQFHAEPISIGADGCEEIWNYFRSQIGGRDLPYVGIKKVAEKVQVNPLEVKTILMQGIWNRRVLVDLFRPILMDRPLVPMQIDPLIQYRDWFRRG